MAFSPLLRKAATPSSKVVRSNFTSSAFFVVFARSPPYSSMNSGYDCRWKFPSLRVSSPDAIRPDSMMCAASSAVVRLWGEGLKL